MKQRRLFLRFVVQVFIVPVFILLAIGGKQEIFAQQQWVRVLDKTAYSLGVQGNTVYAYENDYNGGRLYRSYNNGANWAQTFQSPQGNISDFYVNGSSVFALQEFAGVWRSFDNGETWQQVSYNGTFAPRRMASRSSNPTFFTRSCMTGRGSTLFVGADQMYRSNDGGTTWNVIMQGLPNLSGSLAHPQDIAVSGNTVFFASGFGLARSLNDGNTWTDVSPPNPNPQLGNTFYSVSINGTTILAFSVYGSIWRSTNNGDSWELVRSMPGVTEGRFVEGNGIIFLSTLNWGVYYSHDNGITWRFLSGSADHPERRALWSAAATGTDLFVGAPCQYGTNCNGVYKTSYSSLPLSTETFTLSGNAGTPGALLTLTRSVGAPLSTTATASGEYSFSGLSEGSYTITPTLENHIFTPTNASVSISGSAQSGVNFIARAGAPLAPAQNCSFFIAPQPLGSTTLTLNWTQPQGGAAGYVVVVQESPTGTPPTGTPQQGEVFSGDAAFNGMTMPPFNGQVVFSGEGTSVTITGLTPMTRYSAVVFPYNGNAGARSYFVQNPATASAQTLDVAPPPVIVSVGSITLVPNALNFGDVALGNTYTRTFTLRYANLTTASITLTPPQRWQIAVGNTAFSAAPVQWATQANVGQVSVRARFVPDANGQFSGDILTEAGSTSAMVRVTGRSSPPSITVSTLTINFGQIPPGEAEIRAYRISYRNLVTPSITVTPPSGFTISTSTTGTFSSLPLTVATAQTGSFVVYVRFAPTALGKVEATLQNHNPEAGRSELTVRGEGLYPTVRLSPSALDFDDVPVGACKVLSYRITPSSSRRQVTDICPPSTGNVQISTVGPNGPFTTQCQSVIFSTTDLRSLQVWVRYCPTVEGELTEGITHTIDPGDNVVKLSLGGFGVRPELEILTGASNGVVNFGNVNVGSVEERRLTVRYRNVLQPPGGTIELSTTASHPFSFESAVPNTFQGSFSSTASVTAATFSLRVRFAPQSAGAVRIPFGAALQAQNGTTTDTFTFVGTGIGASLTANNKRALDFGSQFLLVPRTLSFPLYYENITTNTITVTPPNHNNFLLMDPGTGVFSSTAGITLTVGGNPLSPATGTTTLTARFLPVQANGNPVLTFRSTVADGGIAATETLTLRGTGLVPFLNATTATNQGTLNFMTVPSGAVRYYQYTLSYRNITASTITVDVPSGSFFEVAQSSTGTWTGAGQQLMLSTLQPATNATRSITLWVRYLANNTTTARATLLHTANGGDSRSSAVDNLLCIGSSLLPALRVTPATLNFTTIGITKSSVASYQLEYQNITTQTIRIHPQGGVGFSTNPTGPFTTTGTLEIQTTASDGTLQLWALFTASTTAQTSVNVLHTAPNALGQIAAREDLRCIGRGKPFLMITERGSWECENIKPLQSYVFNVKQPLRAGDTRSEGKILRIEHAGISQPITITAPEGYVISVASDVIQGHPKDGSLLADNYANQTFTFQYDDCNNGIGLSVSKKQGFISHMVNYPATSSNATISLNHAKYRAIFYEDGSFVPKSSFEIWVNSIAPVSCGKTVTLIVASGTGSTTLTLTTVCQNESQTGVCVSDDKRFIPNDKYLYHRFPSSVGFLPPTVPGQLKEAYAQWYICNPVSPQSTIKASEAWKIFDFQGSSNSLLSVTEGFVWDKHPDFIDANGNSKVEYAYFGKLYKTFAEIPVLFEDHKFRMFHPTASAYSAAAIGNNGIGMAGIDWHSKILSGYSLQSNIELTIYQYLPIVSSNKLMQGIHYRTNSESTLANNFTSFVSLLKLRRNLQ